MVTPSESPDSSVMGWLSLAAVVLACLVVGFAGGWVLRGDGDGTLAAASVPATTESTTAETPAAEAPLLDRDEVRLTVLNGVGVSGAAGAAAEQAESVGYEEVETGDTGRVDGPTIVYHRDAPRLAQRVAEDLEVTVVRPLPAELVAAAGNAYVVVVLGPG